MAAVIYMNTVANIITAFQTIIGVAILLLAQIVKPSAGWVKPATDRSLNFVSVIFIHPQFKKI